MEPSDVFQPDWTKISDWKTLKGQYKPARFDRDPCERIEKDGVVKYQLNEKLQYLEEFWRFHIAPATNRGENTRFRPGTREVVICIAQHNYEVYCNIYDALEELGKLNLKEPGVLEGQIRAMAPRYRPCLNILRCAGDALLLFDELLEAIQTGLSSKFPVSPVRSRAQRPLVEQLGLENISFASVKSSTLKNYRNSLVHHGRPWLFFKSKNGKGEESEEFESMPWIIKRDRIRGPQLRMWSEQIKMWHKDKSQFVMLPEACKDTCDSTIAFLNESYKSLVQKLDEALDKNREAFRKYRDLWARQG